jgi:hypothetical protein
VIQIHLGRLRPYLNILDWAGMACQGHTLQLIMKIRKLRTKKYYNIGPAENLSESLEWLNAKLFARDN